MYLYICAPYGDMKGKTRSFQGAPFWMTANQIVSGL